MKSAFILMIALLAPAAHAQSAPQTLDCANPITDADMNQCAIAVNSSDEGALNTAYQQIQAGFTAAKATDAAEALRTAERSWIKTRDLSCASATFGLGGTDLPLALGACKDAEARARTQFLTQFYLAGSNPSPNN
jgi:uncharacterized protein YecT (DUF1311 family)